MVCDALLVLGLIFQSSVILYLQNETKIAKFRYLRK